jgi:hypothetical protein
LLLEDLELGDEILLVRPDGTLALSQVTAIASTRADAETRAWRLLTAIGDIVLTGGSRVMTREGPLSASQIAGRLDRGLAVRLEVLSPIDLPVGRGATIPEREVYRACLASLARPVIQLPSELARERALDDRIQALLKEASLRFRRIEDERWLAYALESVRPRPKAGRSRHEAQVQALLLATAWIDGESPVSRTPLDDRRARRRLLAALATQGRGFEVKWLPSYYPVEARVRVDDDVVRRPFVPVHTLLLESDQPVRVETSGGGHLVLDLAVVTAANR